MTENWKCYFHNGPCRLLKKSGGVSLEKHSNGIYVWWEVYSQNMFKTWIFERKSDAIHHFDCLVEIEKEEEKVS
ncbi:hypothetical protein DRO69_02045 [Candidatus Bathyarchaeota archaeon]|nr:MAG: hypothetical protein DRO69_02045 [Candidatus Bathyarchaeota archaeon]